MRHNKLSSIGFATLLCLTLCFLGCLPPPAAKRISIFYYADDSDSMVSVEKKRVDDFLQEQLARNSKAISIISVVKFGTQTNPLQVNPETFEFPPLPNCQMKPDPRDVVSNANERMKKECAPKEKEYSEKVQEVLLRFKSFVSKEEPEPSCTDFKELRARLKMDEPAYGLIKTDGFTECRDKKVETFEQKGKLVIIQVPSTNPQEFERNTVFLATIFPKATIIRSTEVESVKRALDILLGDLMR